MVTAIGQIRQQVRELTKRVLIDAGFEVTEARDAREALEHSANGVFDVLLTDVVMPPFTSAALLAALRR